MRTAIALSGILAAALLTAVPASAQNVTADTNHPFCLKAAGGSQATECRFDTMAACQVEADKHSGSAGHSQSLCVENPRTAMGKGNMKAPGTMSK